MSKSYAIKAIETEYAGRRFRSRQEAKWAVFFDHLMIDWEYEPEGFQTSAGWYLPDFRIEMPSDGYPYWFEVKPSGDWVEERHRAVAVETAMPMVVASGMPRDYGDQMRRHGSSLTAILWGDRGEGARAYTDKVKPEIYPAAFVGKLASGPAWGSCSGMYDAIHKGRTWVCDSFGEAHIALYGPGLEQDHQHRTPHMSPDVDAAYRAAHRNRFGT